MKKPLIIKCLKLFLLCGLFFAGVAQATAPRIAAQLFGEERRADIAAYSLSSTHDAAAKAEEELTLELVRSAYRAAGQEISIDVMPSRQLAHYALSNGDVAILLGTNQDREAQYRAIAFLPADKGEQVVSLIFDLKTEQGKKRQQAFVSGLSKIMANGQYAHLYTLYRGKDAKPEAAIQRIKQLNQKVK